MISECGCSLYNGVAALMAIHQKMSGILAGTKKDHINEVTVRGRGGAYKLISPNLLHITLVFLEVYLSEAKHYAGILLGY